MKRPIVNQDDRMFVRLFPNSLTAGFIEMRIAKLHMRRALDGTLLIKFIKKVLDSISK